MIELAAEHGGDPARPGKKDPLDPLVWLAKRPDEPSWTPGSGRAGPAGTWSARRSRPGTWDRCSTSRPEVRDLIFPHHEMSASHAQGRLPRSWRTAFARRYAHAGMVRLDGQRCPSRWGNLVFVSAAAGRAGHDPMAIRLAILAHHYRADWDWTSAALAAAVDRLTIGAQRSLLAVLWRWRWRCRCGVRCWRSADGAVAGGSADGAGYWANGAGERPDDGSAALGSAAASAGRRPGHTRHDCGG